MKMILSPAKTFAKVLTLSDNKPYFLSDAKKLMKELNRVDPIILKRSMKLSDALLDEVTSFMKQFGKKTYQAISTYDGQAFKQLNVSSLSDEDIFYMNDHLFILSGLYGLLKPDDGISLYRLEMQDRTLCNLDDFWKPKITKYLRRFAQDELIIDLTSEEYRKVLPDHANIIHIDFIEIKQGKGKRISMTMKTMRGLFARYIIQHQIEDCSSLKSISINQFSYDESRSDQNHYIYVKEENA